MSDNEILIPFAQGVAQQGDSLTDTVQRTQAWLNTLDLEAMRRSALLFAGIGASYQCSPRRYMNCGLPGSAPFVPTEMICQPARLCWPTGISAYPKADAARKWCVSCNSNVTDGG
jgi:hypothetical protein